VLSAEYGPWLASPQNSLGSLAVCANGASDLWIVSPQPGTIYFLDPDLPADAQWIPLRALATGEVTWSCTSLPCDTSGPRRRAQLREGKHVISARDPATGLSAETRIEVREL